MKLLMLLAIPLYLVGTTYAKNNGRSGPHLVVKKDEIKWTPAPASLPAGAEIAVIDGDPTKPGEFTMRIKFPANYIIPPHVHPADEHITVLEGSLIMGIGDKLNSNKIHNSNPGDYFRMSKGTKHFAMTKAPVVIQLHGNGPWGITYVNLSDDPRANHSD